tara:strand:+ start:226 stop:831 length:606 start_codon:yes stop_codon:yes gene_type:complete
MFGLCSFSQEFEVTDTQIDTGKTSMQGTYKTIKPELVLKAEGTPQELYNKTLNWIEETYKNPEIVTKAKIEGKYIRLRGVISNLLVLYAPLGGTEYFDVRYTIEIKFKENRFKYEVIQYERYWPSNQYSVGGYMDASFVFKVAAAKGKPNRKTGARAFGKFDKSTGDNYRSVKSYFEKLGRDIQEYILKSDEAFDDSDDDW